MASCKRRWQFSPAIPDPYFHLGQAYQATGKYREAAEVLTKSIALNPSLSHNDYQVTSAHYRLGQALLKLGQNEAAQKELQVAAELKSNSLKRDKEKNESYLAAANLREPNSKFPEIVAPEGVIAESNGPEARIAEDLKALKLFLSKVIANAHNEIALLRADNKDFKAATERFTLAAKWDPQLVDLNYNWGLAAFKADLFKEAVTPLEKELKDHPTNVQARQLLGLSYFMLEDYPKASELLSDVIASKPSNVRRLLHAGPISN